MTQITTAPQGQYFAGDYVKDIVDLCVISLLTGKNSLLIGAPRWGKTDIAEAILRQVYPSAFAKVQLHGANQPGEIRGEIDFKFLIEHSEIRYNRTNTPYDPIFFAGLLDELSRTGETILSLLIFLMDQKFVRPMPFISTANFLPAGKQHDALLERVAFWHHVVPTTLDAKAMSIAQMSRRETDPPLLVPGRLPTAAEIAAGYNALPGPLAMEVISDKVAQIEAQVRAKGWITNPERIGVWSKTLFRVGYWLTGGNDNFSTIPDEALNALRFAWVSKTEVEYNEWKALLKAMVDPVAAKLDEIMDKAAEAVNTASDLPDVKSRNNFQPALLAADEALQGMIDAFPAHQAKLERERERINDWFAALARGKKVSRQ